MEIQIGNVVENDDGSCTVDIDYDQEALEMGRVWAELRNYLKGQESIDVANDDEVMQGYVISMLEDKIKQEEEKEEKAIDADK